MTTTPRKTATRFRLLRAAPLVICLTLLTLVSPSANSLDAQDPVPEDAPTLSAGDPATQKFGGSNPPAGDNASTPGGPADHTESNPSEVDPPVVDETLETPMGARGGSPAPVRGTVTARVPVPVAEKDKALTVMRAYVGVAASALAASRPPATDELGAFAVGPAQGAILADAAEFENNGWHQEGMPTLDGLDVIAFDESATPARMTVNACIDSSKVRVVTAEGEVLREGSSSSRSLNVLSLVRDDSGDWLVQNISFPDDPTC